MKSFWLYFLFVAILIYHCFGYDPYDDDWCQDQSCLNNNCDIDTSCRTCCGANPDNGYQHTCIDYGEKCPKMKWYEYVMIGFGALLFFWYLLFFSYGCIYGCKNLWKCNRTELQGNVTTFQTQENGIQIASTDESAWATTTGESREIYNSSTTNNPKTVVTKQAMRKNCFMQFFYYSYFAIYMVLLPFILSFFLIYRGIHFRNNCEAYPWAPWFSIGFGLISLLSVIEWCILLCFLQRGNYYQKRRITTKRFWANWKDKLGNKIIFGYFHVILFIISTILALFAAIWGLSNVSRNDEDNGTCQDQIALILDIGGLFYFFALYLPIFFFQLVSSHFTRLIVVTN